MDEECADDGCPVARAVQILDGRWTMLVIRDLLGGTKRFTELRTSLVGISPKTLTDRLRSLEEHGLVLRVIHAEVPPRVEYTLTDTGLSLEPAIRALGAWGATMTPAPAGTPEAGVSQPLGLPSPAGRRGRSAMEPSAEPAA
ncbi:DNA-binding HxlR family transcriptional regulator [Streptacidiphilus sp. MAP12-16]|uniref:winged helix-turn-helix transcriptional regulator n=1 Tax=Streptacidiphilus sp. MAP12-16 TaxID=3156300 RepID=UPI0035189808